MSKDQVKETAKKILDDSMVGTMATVKGNKPHSRYMTFFNDGLTLYTATNEDTDKTSELENNPYTHVLIGYEGDGFGDEYLEYEGKTTVYDSTDMNEKVWNKAMEAYFDGPDDPKMIVLKVEPTAIRVLNKTGKEPKEVEF